MTRAITLGFLLLLALILVMYWTGAVSDINAFTTAVVNVANNFTGRNAQGKPGGYPTGTPSGGGGSPPPGGGGSTPCGILGISVGQPCIVQTPGGGYQVGSCYGGKCVSAFGGLITPLS